MFDRNLSLQIDRMHAAICAVSQMPPCVERRVLLWWLTLRLRWYERRVPV